MTKLDYRRPDPRVPRQTFWKSDAGGWVGMALWLVGFMAAPFVMHVAWAWLVSR